MGRIREDGGSGKMDEAGVECLEVEEPASSDAEGLLRTGAAGVGAREGEDAVSDVRAMSLMIHDAIISSCLLPPKG